MLIEKITRRGKEYVVLPMHEFQKLVDESEMLADVKAFDAAKERLNRGDDELIPLAILERNLAGENSLKIWREYSRLTQEGLANLSTVTSHDCGYRIQRQNWRDRHSEKACSGVAGQHRPIDLASRSYGVAQSVESLI